MDVRYKEFDFSPTSEELFYQTGPESEWVSSGFSEHPMGLCLQLCVLVKSPVWTGKSVLGEVVYSPDLAELPFS